MKACGWLAHLGKGEGRVARAWTSTVRGERRYSMAACTSTTATGVGGGGSCGVWPHDVEGRVSPGSGTALAVVQRLRSCGVAAR